jgi:hypothetical protein
MNKIVTCWCERPNGIEKEKEKFQFVNYDIACPLFGPQL